MTLLVVRTTDEGAGALAGADVELVALTVRPAGALAATVSAGVLPPAVGSDTDPAVSGKDTLVDVGDGAGATLLEEPPLHAVSARINAAAPNRENGRTKPPHRENKRLVVL